MKSILLILLNGLLFIGLVVSCSPRKVAETEAPLAPEQYRRPKDMTLTQYAYSTEDLKNKFSEDMMQRAAIRREMVNEVNRKGQWKPAPESIDKHVAPEWFEDAKFGMFVDWGLWSIAGWAAKKPVKEEQQGVESRTYPDWYELRMYNEFKDYHEKNWGKDFKRDHFIPLFTASQYEPEKLVDLAVEAGMKYVIPFTKHCTGFCLWPSSFTRRDVGDMGPKRDLTRPLIESCKKKGLKFGFYLCIDEWEYPLIDSTGKIVNKGGEFKKDDVTDPKELELMWSGKIPVKNYYTDYQLPLATEFIDNYDPDILWFDLIWRSQTKYNHSYDIAAYFYNQAQGRKEVAVSDRFGGDDEGAGLRWIRGDFYTDESEANKYQGKKLTHAWEKCRGISSSYGFNWQDNENNVISPKSFIKMFVDIVSQGGNLLLMTNLDAQGALPEVQEKRLKDIGNWLKVNGEGIYATRRYPVIAEGNVRYTRSKDNKMVYAIATEWPGKQLILTSVTPKAGTEIKMLGFNQPLKWYYGKEEHGVTIIELPEILQEEANRPCKYAYTFKIEN